MMNISPSGQIVTTSLFSYPILFIPSPSHAPAPIPFSQWSQKTIKNGAQLQLYIYASYYPLLTHTHDNDYSYFALIPMDLAK